MTADRMDRILVVLPNWFGETLFVTPFLRALRAFSPNAWIATLGWPQCRAVLLHNPRVNKLLEYDERGAHRGPVGKWRLIRSLRRQRFDCAFILRRSLSRSLLLMLAGVPRRVGFANAKSGWLLTHRVTPSSAPVHKAFTYVPLLEALGASAPRGFYDYIVHDTERAAAARLLDERPGAEGGPLVIVHPGANWLHKRWPADRFAALADRLIADRGAHILVTGSPDDAPLADDIKRKMRHAPTILAGRTTLRELAVLLEQAQVVISNDTGVLHIAAALGRPVVALYGPTSPALTGPLGEPERMIVLHHPDCCPEIPCFAPDRPPHPGMDSISVEEAYAAAVKLLQGHQ